MFLWAWIPWPWMVLVWAAACVVGIVSWWDRKTAIGKFNLLLSATGVFLNALVVGANNLTMPDFSTPYFFRLPWVPGRPYHNLQLLADGRIIPFVSLGDMIILASLLVALGLWVKGRVGSSVAHPPTTKVWRNEAGVLEEYRVKR